MSTNLERFKKDFDKLITTGHSLELAMQHECVKAEFEKQVKEQLGKDQVFRIPNKWRALGIAVSAYGEFLCVCRTFKDGSSTFLERYVNFSEYARADD